MTAGVTTAPLRSSRDGAPSWELAYRLEEADHLAHWRWLLGARPAEPPPAPITSALASCFVLFFLFSVFPLIVAVLCGLGLVPRDVFVWTCLVSGVLAFMAWTSGVVGGKTAQTLQKDDEARQAVAVRLATGGIRLGRDDRVSFGAADVVEVTELRHSEPGFDLHERKETRFSWALIARVQLLDEVLVFIVADKGSLIVPRRCFPDEETFREFYAFVQERLGGDDRVTARPASPEGVSQP
jgi:hypothetical protein